MPAAVEPAQFEPADAARVQRAARRLDPCRLQHFGLAHVAQVEQGTRRAQCRVHAVEGLDPDAGQVGRRGEHRVEAVQFIERAEHPIGQRTRAPEPQGVDRGATARRARCVDRMLVQDHLHLVEQPAPAPAFVAARQVQPEVAAQGLFRRAECRQARALRQAQVPAPGAGRIEHHAFVAEHRLERAQQFLDLVRVQRQAADREQAGRDRLQAHVRGIGAQPRRAGDVVRRVDAAGQGRRARFARMRIDQAGQRRPQARPRRSALASPADQHRERRDLPCRRQRELADRGQQQDQRARRARVLVGTVGIHALAPGFRRRRRRRRSRRCGCRPGPGSRPGRPRACRSARAPPAN